MNKTTKARIAKMIRLHTRRKEWIGEVARFDGMDLKGYNFGDADLRGSSFVGADLTGADFSNGCLAGADFTGANLEGANFQDADLREAILFAANVKDAYFLGTILSGACVSKKGFEDINANKTVLRRFGFVICD